MNTSLHFHRPPPPPQSTHRVAMANLRRTFPHDGKTGPAWRVWGPGGARPLLFTITSKVVVYAPENRADTHPLFSSTPYMYSVRTPTYDTILIYASADSQQ